VRAARFPGSKRKERAVTRHASQEEDRYRASRGCTNGTDDLLVSEIIRTGELEAWFLAEHLVDTPLVRTDAPMKAGAGGRCWW